MKKKNVEYFESQPITAKQDEKGKNPFENNMKLFLILSTIFYVLGGIYFELSQFSRFDKNFIFLILIIDFLIKFRFLQKNDVGFGKYQLTQGLREYIL